MIEGGEPLLGGFRVPLNRLLVILKNAFALFLKPANGVLGAEQTLHLEGLEPHLA